VHNIDELKQRLLHVWHGIDQTIIDNAIGEWRVRLRACVRTKGEHFEQLCCDNTQPYDKNISVFVKCDTIFVFCFVNYHKFELLNFAR